MDIDESLAAIHAYLCADGYVIKNPPEQKQKYYKVGLRNTNFTLLQNFRQNFYHYFKVRPHLRKGERCEIGSRQIYELLTKEFGSFYSWEWRMPKLNEPLSKIWLRVYFDCEGWVFCKKHQNRHIGLDCVNGYGLNQVIKSLKSLGITSIKKFNQKRRIFRMFIYGKDNLLRFKEKIGFLHPKKSNNLDKAINDFMVYEWRFPSHKEKCKKFIRVLLENKIRIKKPYFVRIISKEKKNLEILKELLKKFYDINCLLYDCVNGGGTKYYEININKKEETKKMKKLVPKVFKSTNIP